MVRNCRANNVGGSSSSSSGDASHKPLLIANIVSKLAIYFLSFGLVLLVLGGVRALIFPSNQATTVLVVLGLTTAGVGICFTVFVIIAIKLLNRHGALDDVEDTLPTVAGQVASRYDHGLVNFGHADFDKWEAPPPYDQAMRDDSPLPAATAQTSPAAPAASNVGAARGSRLNSLD